MKRIISLLLIISLFLLFVGCNDTVSSQSSSQNEPSDVISETPNVSAKEVLDEILTQEEQQNYFDTIYDIEFGPPIGNYCYFDAPEAHSKLFSIGLKGVPMLIYENAYYGSVDEPHMNTEGSICHFHFYIALASLLRANECTVYGKAPKTGNYFRENLYHFFNDAKTTCPQIMKLSIDTDEKFRMLRKYGILAIPYVLEEIDKGNSCFETYFQEIGAHLTTEEYAEAVCFYNVDTISGHDELYDKVHNHPKAQNFNYKVWLSENGEDLNNLFDFIDAFCAEYEAEYN